MLIAISTLHGFEINHTDVKTVFLNGELHKGEDIKGVKGWESQNYLGLIFLTYLLENESHTFNEAMSSS